MYIVLFLFFSLGSIGEDHDEIVEVAFICIIVDLTKSPYCLVFSCLSNARRFQLSPMHVHYYYGYQPGQPWPYTNLGQKPKLGGVRISHRHYIYVHTHSLLDVGAHTFSL